MFPGVMALFMRSLREGARALGQHLARFGLATATCISIILAVNRILIVGAPGLSFFRNVAHLDLVFMTLLGLSFFSTPITEEKEEDTLGLILMAGISPLGILLGKSSSRLIQAILLVAVQYPITLLAITLGGITHLQVQALYAALFAYLIMLSGIGLFCSTIARCNKTAATRMLIFVVGYLALPMIVARLPLSSAVTPGIATVFDWVAHSCVFFQMDMIFASGYSDSVFSQQVISNTALGVLGFLFSWALFGVAVRQPSTESDSRGLVVRPHSFNQEFLVRGLATRIAYHRFRDSDFGGPIAWKDFYFVAGGRAGVLLRVGFFALLYLIIRIFYVTTFAPTTEEQITAGFLFFAAVAMSIDLSMLVSRSLHSEIRAHTLASLLVLPISTRRVLWAKITGVLQCWLASLSCFLVSIFWLPGGLNSFCDFFYSDGQFYSNRVWIMSHLILLPHLAAVFAVYVRWGALSLSLCCLVGIFIVEASYLNSLRIPANSMRDHWASMEASIGVLVAAGICHRVVWKRAQLLGAR